MARRQPLNDTSDSCMFTDSKHEECPVLFPVHVTPDDMAFGSIAVCDCECHNKRREEVINLLINLRDCVDDPFKIDVQKVAGMSCDDENCTTTAMNHIIDAVGDALTFLGYPNQPEE